MLEELLKHAKVWNKRELLFFLFDGIASLEQQPVIDVQTYCNSCIFIKADAFYGIVKLCQFISFINIIDNKMQV